MAVGIALVTQGIWKIKTRFGANKDSEFLFFLEILTGQNYFLGHMEAYQDSQKSFLITQLKSISPLLFLKKKKFQLLLTVYYIAQ